LNFLVRFHVAIDTGAGQLVFTPREREQVTVSVQPPEQTP
jgi:hypothetical protein